jgi:amidase
MGGPQSSGIMTAEELAITESSAVDLVSEMADGKLTSVSVSTAFYKRAALAHQLASLPSLTLNHGEMADKASVQ